MKGLPPGADASLAPLRADILARAQTRADAVLDDAAHRADATAAEATREVEAIGRRAVEAGVAAARADASLRSARERRRAHELRLGARESLHAELEALVLARAEGLRDSPTYPAMREALSDRAVTVLGSGATVEEDARGGVVATLGTRRLDLTLPTLAKATLESMGGEVSDLWTE
ncbi:hypothetical protein RN607_02485 [Demequina capsici]|uniref:Uncharacterized protein n=1 Tax=Demequina capsici TaxID=3075620 RepID=A0AA96FEI7_9MICO|nr:hypothetical protein [Demequina sp. PMTSA13]WNM27892.1 hypothetical protein RN607_02485 [Demequina sp. PMTSA13]